MILERAHIGLIAVEIVLHIIRQAHPLIQVRVRIVVQNGVTHHARVLSIDPLELGIITTALVMSPHHYTMILERAPVGLIIVEIMLHIIRQMPAPIQVRVTMVKIMRHGATQHA